MGQFKAQSGAVKNVGLLEALEDLDKVQNVGINTDISKSVFAKVQG